MYHNEKPAACAERPPRKAVESGNNTMNFRPALAMTKLNLCFACCIQQFNAPAGAARVPAEMREAYRESVRQLLLDFWKQCGAGIGLVGRFHLVRPPVSAVWRVLPASSVAPTMP